MNIDKTPIKKYILINTGAKPSYAYLGYARLTTNEMHIKNRAFKMNRASKKYILEKDWK